MGKVEEDRECPEEVVNVPYWMRLVGQKIDQSLKSAKYCQIVSPKILLSVTLG